MPEIKLFGRARFTVHGVVRKADGTVVGHVHGTHNLGRLQTFILRIRLWLSRRRGRK